METQQCVEGVLLKLELDGCVPSITLLLPTARGVRQDEVGAGFTEITHWRLFFRLRNTFPKTTVYLIHPSLLWHECRRQATTHALSSHLSPFHGTGSPLYRNGELAGRSDSIRRGCAEPGGGTMIFTLLVPEDFPMHGGSADQGGSARVSPATVRN